MVEAMIEIADPRFFLVIASAQLGIRGGYRFLYGVPLPSAMSIFGRSCL
jgi:hypothetical protein